MDSDGVPGFLQNSSSPSSRERGFSSPDLDSGVGVYANQCEVLNENIPVIERIGVTPSSLPGGIPIARDFDFSQPHQMNARVQRERALDIMELNDARKQIKVLREFINKQGLRFEEFLEAPGEIGSTIQPLGTKTSLRGNASGAGTTDKPNPYIDKLKGQIVQGQQVFEELPKNSIRDMQHQELDSAGNGGSKVPQETHDENIVIGASVKTWSNVVKNATALRPQPIFDYIPPPPGETTVKPPDEALNQGIAMFKNCVVGEFTKGTINFSAVVNFARNLWGPKGLISVNKRDDRTFIFKFSSELQMHNMLSKGTWYIDRKPMVVHAWGVSIKKGKITNIPLWVQFSNIPDIYWNKECLSRLVSMIGRPLCADEHTAKLGVMPYARFCIDYKIGDELPTSILHLF